jgi:hypothetical protein
MIIADLDKKSKGEGGKAFRSILLEGILQRDAKDGTFGYDATLLHNHFASLLVLPCNLLCSTCSHVKRVPAAPVVLGYHSILLTGLLKHVQLYLHTQPYTNLCASAAAVTVFCSIVWGKEHALFSGHNEAGRGMELSELVDFQVHIHFN